MEVSSRQIVILAAPVVVIYLTWSAVSGFSTTPLQVDQGSSISTVAASKRPVVAKLTRDVFSEEGFAAVTGGAPVPGQGGGSNAVRLDGTVIAGTWRMAIIDGTRVFEGQTFRGFRVKTVGRDRVTLLNEQGNVVDLSLDIAAPPPLAALEKKAGQGATLANTPATATTAAGRGSSADRDGNPKPAMKAAAGTDREKDSRPTAGQRGATR